MSRLKSVFPRKNILGTLAFGCVLVGSLTWAADALYSGLAGMSPWASASGTGGTTPGKAVTFTPAPSTAVTTPIPCSSSASPDGTTIPASTTLSDCQNHYWSLSQGQPLINQNPAAVITQETTLLLQYSGNVYRRDIHDNEAIWWQWKTDYTGWSLMTKDPRKGGVIDTTSDAAANTGTAPQTN